MVGQPVIPALRRQGRESRSSRSCSAIPTSRASLGYLRLCLKLEHLSLHPVKICSEFGHRMSSCLRATQFLQNQISKVREVWTDWSPSAVTRQVSFQVLTQSKGSRLATKQLFRFVLKKTLRNSFTFHHLTVLSLKLEIVGLERWLQVQTNCWLCRGTRFSSQRSHGDSQ